jgi:hypothetical protein
MTATLIAFAVVALVAVVAGEVADLPFSRRRSEGGRSRLPAPARAICSDGLYWL